MLEQIVTSLAFDSKSFVDQQNYRNGPPEKKGELKFKKKHKKSHVTFALAVGVSQISMTPHVKLN